MSNKILNFVEVQKSLDFASSVNVSADGEFVYATASDNPFTTAVNESAIAVFRRDALTGKLVFVESQQDDIGDIDGLGGAYAVTISPDGRYLYVAGFNDAAIAQFQRDAITGQLSFIDFQQDDDLLGGVSAIAISPDGEFLYAIASQKDTLAIFRRDTISGELALFQVLQDDLDNIDGLGRAYSLILSPDGKFLYVAAINDQAIAVFEWDSDQLGFVELQTGYTDSINDPVIPYSLTISPDGKFLYALGTSGVIAVFQRDINTGSLSLIEIQEDAASDTQGLGGVNTITISPDGKFLYAAIFQDDVVAVFLRDTTTGKLTFREFQEDNTDGVDGLDGVFSLTTSPDGKFIYTAGIAEASVTAFSQNLLINAEGTIINNTKGDIFTIKTSDVDSKPKLQLQLTRISTNTIYELGVFIVDDIEGNINGIAPGTNDYILTALARAKVVLFSLADAPNGFNPLDLPSIMEFNSGDNLRFYLIPNSTTDEVLSGKTPLSQVMFLSPENIQVENDGLSFNLSDLGVKIQTTQQDLPLGINLQGKHQGEVIDLRGVTQLVKADFIVNREASFDNFVGFYPVADENGGIDINGDGTADILVGQAGYTQAAVSRRVSGIDLSVSNQRTATYTGIFQPGAIFAPFVIVNGNPDKVIDANINNDPAVYFPFLGANPDKVDHIHLLGNNTFGFEDLFNGGDRDYNDVIVRVNLSLF
jgi:6-phosphogluconolactonase (cycloisomerase 2 family)